ncbi:hypothetical protein J7K92_00430 [bacterium]|nr:hypothetical protein [bacterium]
MKLEVIGPKDDNIVEVRVAPGEGPGFFMQFIKLPEDKSPRLIAIGRYDKTRLYGELLNPPPALLSRSKKLAAKRFQKTSRSYHKHITGEQLPLL